MSRYIDADALHDALKAKQKWVVRCGDKHNEGYTYDQVHFAIDEAPSIDIVKCKECRYWEMRNSPRGWCVVHQGYVLPQYFCADGEREDE